MSPRARPVARPLPRLRAALLPLPLLVVSCAPAGPAPGEVDELLVRARAELERGAHEDAERLLEPVLARDPDAAEANFLAGLARYRRAFVSVGMSSVDEDLMRGALERFERAAEARPERAEFALHAGLAHEKMKEMAEACAWFERALEADPLLERALLRLGADRLLLGRLDEAAEPLERLLAQQPGHAEALQRLGLVDLERGEWESAVEHLRAALDRGASGALHHDLANALRRMGRDAEADRALAAFEEWEQWQDAAQLVQLRGLTPEASAALERADGLRARGAAGEALAAYREVLDLEPHCLEAWLGLGAVHYGRGELAPARTAYEEVLRRSAGDARAHRGLGLVRAAQRDFAGALASFERALASGAVDAELLADAGAAAYVLQRADASRDYLSRALVLDPENTRAMLNLGLLLEGRGDAAGAAGLYRRVLALEPGNPAAREALGRVGGAQ